MVFDGSRPDFSAEDKKTPITEYGRQKAGVEDWLLSHSSSSAIIRFGKVLPPSFHLFLQWQHELRAGNKITPYSNKVMAPLSLDIAVEILCLLISARKPGIFQATACSDITYLDAALHLTHLWKANPTLVEAIKSPNQGMVTTSQLNTEHFGTLQISPCFDHLLQNLSQSSNRIRDAESKLTQYLKRLSNIVTQCLRPLSCATSMACPWPMIAIGCN